MELVVAQVQRQEVPWAAFSIRQRWISPGFIRTVGCSTPFTV
ncbi:MAG: hypothetical protein ACRDRJ_37030 [Streptosporangiaceae bacterium]